MTSKDYLSQNLARNYGTISTQCYGYQVAVIDLRNPTKSDGNNFLSLVNKYVDISEKEPENIAAKAKAEKYAKILAKTIISPDGDSAKNYYVLSGVPLLGKGIDTAGGNACGTAFLGGEDLKNNKFYDRCHPQTDWKQ